MKQNINALLGLGLLLGSCYSHAYELDFSGFISVGGGWVDTDEASYLGYDNDLTFKPDNIFGLQVSAPIGEKFTATAQLVARGGEDYDPDMEWAYLSYQATDNWMLRAGKLRVPFYLMSDYLEVGYLYPWVRPPIELYNNPSSVYSGLDTVYTMPLGSWDMTLQAFFGNAEVDYAEKYPSNLNSVGSASTGTSKNIIGLVGMFTRDWLTLRAVVSHIEFTLDNAVFDGISSGLQLAGLGSIVDDFELRDDTVMYYGLAAQVDYERWLIQGEIAHTDFGYESYAANLVNGYTLIGYRLTDKLMLHGTYGFTNAINSDIGDQIPRGLAPGLDALGAGVDAITDAFVSDQFSYTLGMRYEIMSSIAIKAEWQHVNSAFPSSNIIAPAGFEDSINVFSFVIDAVF